MKNAMIQARVEPHLKANVEMLFSTLGLSTSEAITLFFKQCEMQHGLPFMVRVPNEETLEAMKELESGGLPSYKTTQALWKALKK